AKEVHERAEINDLHHLAGIDHADLGLGHNPLDPVDRRLAGRSVDRGDLDRPVILDVDLGAGYLADFPDHLAAGADDLADLILRNGDDRYARRILTNRL